MGLLYHLVMRGEYGSLNRITWNKYSTSATLSIIYRKWSAMLSNPGLHGEKPVTNYSSELNCVALENEVEIEPQSLIPNNTFALIRPNLCD